MVFPEDIEDVELTRDEKEEIRSHLHDKGLPPDIAVTFKDVQNPFTLTAVVPERYSRIRSRSHITDFRARLFADYCINIPIVPANMECVVGEEMAIAMPREGSFAFIPQMLSLEDRLSIIRKTRRAHSAKMDTPLTILFSATLAEAKKVMRKYQIWSLVVVDYNDRPIGMLGSRDWRYERDETKRVSELMSQSKLITVHEHTTPENIEALFRAHRIEKLPIVDYDGKLAGLYTAHGFFYTMHHPRALRDAEGRFPAMGSVGVVSETKSLPDILNEVERQLEEGAHFILIDTARAYSENAKETILGVKKRFPKTLLVGGNISTPEGAKFLCELGIDCIKVNQGAGSRCLTREVGTGLPQLYAVVSCSVIAHRYGRTTMADGGMTEEETPGDFVNAIIAGADTLMSGAFFIGTHESKAEPYPKKIKIEKEEHAYIVVKDYDGSASPQAQSRRVASGNLDKPRRPEGFSKPMPVTGSVHEKLDSLLGAFESLMSYVGARNLDELRKRGKFVLQTSEGRIEGLKIRE